MYIYVYSAFAGLNNNLVMFLSTSEQQFDTNYIKSYNEPPMYFALFRQPSSGK